MPRARTLRSFTATLRDLDSNKTWTSPRFQPKFYTVVPDDCGRPLRGQYRYVDGILMATDVVSGRKLTVTIVLASLMRSATIIHR